MRGKGDDIWVRVEGGFYLGGMVIFVGLGEILIFFKVFFVLNGFYGCLFV